MLFVESEALWMNVFLVCYQTVFIGNSMKYNKQTNWMWQGPHIQDQDQLVDFVMNITPVPSVYHGYMSEVNALSRSMALPVPNLTTGSFMPSSAPWSSTRPTQGWYLDRPWWQQPPCCRRPGQGSTWQPQGDVNPTFQKEGFDRPPTQHQYYYACNFCHSDNSVELVSLSLKVQGRLREDFGKDQGRYLIVSFWIFFNCFDWAAHKNLAVLVLWLS